MKKKLFLPSIILGALFFSACSNTASAPKTQSVEGGIYKTNNTAETWSRNNSVLSLSGGVSIEGINTNVLRFDPQDSQTLYLGAYANGLLYSVDGAASWSITSLQNDKINDIAISPASKCSLFVGVNNIVKKSSDCARTFEDSFIDSKTNTQMNALAINRLNPAQIYAGNSAGVLYRSDDFGSTWQTIRLFEDSIEKILLDEKSPGRIYVALRNKGINRTEDDGLNWKTLSKGLSNFPKSEVYKDIYLDPKEPNTLIYASGYGLLKTNDSGTTWQSIDTIVPQKEINISAIAVNPNNNKEIYFVNGDKIYLTKDGGQTWVPRPLPSTRSATQLIIDPNNPDILYLGVARLK